MIDHRQIRAARALLNWSQADLARASDMATSSIKNIENENSSSRKESLAHTVPLTSQSAQAEAETFFKLNARRFVVGRGIAEANSQLRVGSYVNLKGLGPLFSGKYYLSEVRQLFDLAHGIRTEFTAERPGIGSSEP